MVVEFDTDQTQCKFHQSARHASCLPEWRDGDSAKLQVRQFLRPA